MKAMCLQAMAIVYGNCYEEIGPFNDTEYIMRKMEQVRGWVWPGVWRSEWVWYEGCTCGLRSIGGCSLKSGVW